MHTPNDKLTEDSHCAIVRAHPGHQTHPAADWAPLLRNRDPLAGDVQVAPTAAKRLSHGSWRPGRGTAVLIAAISFIAFGH